MGAIAESIVAYAQPLLEQTDGSMEQLNKAMVIGQLCWNLALCPEGEREQMLSEMRPGLNMDEDRFNEFRRFIIDPMIRRHQELFPLMHRRGSTAPSPSGPSPRAHLRAASEAYPGPQPAIPTSSGPSSAHSRAAGEAFPGAQPYEPCPCNSGRKYKFCCRNKRR